MKKSFFAPIILLVITAGLSFPTSTFADSLFDTLYPASIGWGGTNGYEFQVGANAVEVTQLGVPWYAGNPGYYGYSGNPYIVQQVKIENTDGSVVTSAVVDTTGASSGYVWNNISPVFLQPNTDYLILQAGYYQRDNLASAYIRNPSVSSGLVSLVSSSQYGYSSDGGLYYSIGPNMQFSIAPYTYSQSGTATVSSTLVGPVAVQQNGSGTTILTAQNSYSGGTVVSSGTLVAQGPNSTTSSLGSGNLTINSGGTVLVNGDNSIGYDSSRTVTVNAGGTLTINAVNTQHLSQLVLNGGSLSSSSTLSTIQQNYGTFNLDNGVTVSGSQTTSVINAQNVTLTQSGGTVFNVSAGATNGIDLLVSGTFGTAPLQTPSTGLILQGTGVMEMTASNSFTGPTVVNSGTLIISSTGSLSGGGNTTVGTNGILKNNGTIAGTTTVNGTLGGNGGSFSTLKINGGASLNWNLSSITGNAGTGWDLLNASNLDLSGLSSSNRLTINILGTSGLGNASSSYTFNLLNVSGSITGFNTNDFTLNSSLFTMDPSIAGGTWSINTAVVGGVNELQATYVVPEPSTYALFGLGALALIVAYRRKVS
jgi:autotransporter-associated beta strand protein